MLTHIHGQTLKKGMNLSTTVTKHRTDNSSKLLETKC